MSFLVSFESVRWLFIVDFLKIWVVHLVDDDRFAVPDRAILRFNLLLLPWLDCALVLLLIELDGLLWSTISVHGGFTLGFYLIQVRFHFWTIVCWQVLVWESFLGDSASRILGQRIVVDRVHSATGLFNLREEFVAFALLAPFFLFSDVDLSGIDSCLRFDGRLVTAFSPIVLLKSLWDTIVWGALWDFTPINELWKFVWWCQFASQILLGFSIQLLFALRLWSFFIDVFVYDLLWKS